MCRGSTSLDYSLDPAPAKQAMGSFWKPLTKGIGHGSPGGPQRHHCPPAAPTMRHPSRRRPEVWRALVQCAQTAGLRSAAVVKKWSNIGQTVDSGRGHDRETEVPSRRRSAGGRPAARADAATRRDRWLRQPARRWLASWGGSAATRESLVWPRMAVIVASRPSDPVAQADSDKEVASDWPAVGLPRHCQPIPPGPRAA